MDDLLTELKRRNVFKVAIAYLVVGWLAIQVIVSVAEPLNLPAWVPSFVIVLLAIGFPIALLFAWAYELTPEGIKKSKDVELDTSISHKTSRKIDFIIIGALVLIIGGLGFERMNMAPPAAEVTGENAALNNASIAVLAFADMSAEGDQEYFGDGISEALLNVLAKIKELDVSPRTSSFAFKGKDRNVPDIAKILNVKHVLEGSVKKAGNHVLITAQLLDATENRHLWSDTYERELTTENIFAIQAEIASEIVAALGDELGIGLESDISADPLTANMDAYELYLQAKKAGEISSTENRYLQDKLLERAVSLDPGFAEAWAMHANILSILPTWDHSLNMNSYQLRAIEAAKRALALDPTNELAYDSLSGAYIYNHDFEKSFAIAAKTRSIIPDFEIGVSHNMSLGYIKKSYDQAVSLSKKKPANGFNYVLQALYFEIRSENKKAIKLYELAALKGYHGAEDNTANLYWAMGDTSIWTAYFSRELMDNDPELLPLLPILYDLKIGLKENKAQAIVQFKVIVKEMGFKMENLLQESPRWGLRIPSDIAVEFGGAEKVAALYWGNSPKFWMWTPTLHDFRQTESFRSHVRSSGMLAYWQEHGWPDLCRAVDDDDFECD